MGCKKGKFLMRYHDQGGPLKISIISFLLIIALLCPGNVRAQELPWVVKEPGPDSRLLLSWARALLSAGKDELAISYLEEEVKMNPGSVEGHMLLGKASWKLGRIGNAIKAWSKVASLSPEHRPVAELRLKRLRRLEGILLVSPHKTGEGETHANVVLSALAELFSDLGFKVSQAAGYGPLEKNFPDLWAGAPKALDEAGSIANLIILVETPYIKEEINQGGRINVTLKAKAFEVQSRKELAHIEVSRASSASIPVEARNRALSYAGSSTAQELLVQILKKEALMPDIVIRPQDIILPRPSLVSGIPVTVEIGLRNQGDDDAENFDVRIWDIATEKSQALRAFRVASLPTLSSAVLSFEWIPSGPGLHKLTVGIDPDEKIPDADRSSNTASRQVFVLSEEELRSNLYEFAMAYTARGSKERDLLEAEREVMINPKDKALLDRLERLAIDYEKEAITVIGVGLRPWNVFSEAAAAPIARRLAKQDAQRWVSLLQANRKKGGTPSTQKGTVYGARVIAEQRLPDGSYWVKVQAPLE